MTDAKPGKIIYGSWKDGSDIYKDSNGYFVLQYSPKQDKIVKKYLKRWKPKDTDDFLCLTKKKWKLCKAGKTRKHRKASTLSDEVV
jgi:hypothetical protein